MASEKQLQANRRNAQLSTGPVSPEGKAISSQNAFKHGLRSRKILYEEKEESLQPIRDGLIAEWQPRTHTEWALVEQMAVALHKRNCYEELEAESESRVDDQYFSPALQIIWRRQAALERSFYRALDSLLKLRKCRAAESKAAAPEPAESSSRPEPAPQPSPAPAPPALLHLPEQLAPAS